jgi:hypothetical protein
MTDVAVQIRWRATKSDGIGHAFAGKGPAMCGEANQEERYDWPRRERCVPCDEKLLFAAARV